MPIIEISSLSDPNISVFTNLTDHQLRNKLNEKEGIIIAESPKVIDVALKSGLKPISILCERKHINGDAKEIISKCNIPVYTGERETLSKITGYILTRGVLCAFKRPIQPTVSEILENTHRIAILDGIVDTTNMGAIFRCAAALNIDAVLVTTASCDPLSRRSIRVSMGNVFLTKWTWLTLPIESIRDLGFKTVAMALNNNTIDIDSPILKKENKLAIILGTEGDGLSQSVIKNADYSVKIPMYNGVDSLNVTSAAAIAFWEFKKNNSSHN